ncbi:MAG: WecB/TagA/CpsF family glycosyltransferase [Bacteroidaceae bacterium]|nr:WecB/TagA/CpsF family glycosyltransferase [Bacteroidaceae bacterium]MBQ8365381.1 WecB/TagA/CpsF family glycosyltransferase [Bacteroidaceae bacterium]
MEQYFDIRYELNKDNIHKLIALQIEKCKPAYICAADGNILAMVNKDEEYRNIVNGSLFSICDSSWVPVFARWIYGKRFNSYRGSDIFTDIINSRKYRMIFLGTNKATLDALKSNLVKRNPEIGNMQFCELPYCDVEEFDYPAIAQTINKDNADIIWVALGAPKQEIFMHHLQPHLKKGVAIAVGAVFNFFSGLPGLPKSAPRWMAKCRLEFIHRILWEPPKQIKRCWGILVHLPRILRKEYVRKRNEQQ